MKAPKTWILVADGGTAIVFANTGKSRAHEALISIVPNGQFAHENHHKHLGAPHGAGTANARGDARYSIGSHERRERLAEERFLERVLAWLDAPPQSELFDNLIVAAPPRALGELRTAMSAALQRKLSHEIHADLTKCPIKEIESHVFRHLIPIYAAPR